MTTAFVFPGQGSLESGALHPWREHPARSVIDGVARRSAVDLWDLPEDVGERTAMAQPAIFAASLAAHRALLDAGLEPDVVAGHSLGEVTATVAAGALSADDGAALVTERGRAFANACACSPGTMLALLRLEEDTVRQLVEDTPGAAVANVNAPGQIVVSGSEEAMETIRERAREQGGRALPLTVEGAFHSSAMAPAMVRVDLMLRRLDLGAPAVRLLSGTTGGAVQDADQLRAALVDGVLAPVEWVAVQRSLERLGVDHIVEVGPGGVLAGLAKRTLSGLTITTVAGPGDVEQAVRADATPIDVTDSSARRPAAATGARR